jgi:HlyD family type I secretion membrane fusion protein
MSATTPTSIPTRPTGSLRTPIVIGVAVLATFVAGFSAWVALAPLSGAAIAFGVVSPDGNRKTVQHLEGGIIREILVEDGRSVAAGDTLIRLDDTATRATHDRLQARYLALSATRARLVAEQAGAERITFPEELDDGAHPDAGALRAAEIGRFETRRTALAGQRDILRQLVAQRREEIGGLGAEIASQTEQLRLIAEEAADVADLLKRGLERKPRLLALKRGTAQIEGLRAENQAKVARARQAIREAELKILNLDSTRQDEIAAELSRIGSELFDLEEQLRASADILRRLVVTAPVTGTVVGLRFRTAGGVVAAGEAILDLVPADDELLIDAKVAPTDIDVVHAGLVAQVHFLAYRQRTMMRIDGRVRQVSADSLTDPDTGQPYFAARIEIDRQQLAELAPEVALTPGMPAEVLVLTGERTMLETLLDPIRTVFRRGLRET